MTVIINGTTGITSPSDNLSGNLTFTGTGNRITGDFSNATAANRVSFQSSTTNGASIVQVLPNGTATTSGFIVSQTSDTTGTGGYGFLYSTSAEFRLTSGVWSGSSYLPMTFYTGGSERMRIDTSGNVGIGTSSPASKLQIGSSSTSTQAENIDMWGALAGSNGDIGRLRFYNINAFGNKVIAQVSGARDGNNYGGALVFSTGTQADSTITERARIDSSGNFQMNSGYGSVATAYGCRAWVNFNGTGTVAIRASGNVSSITDNGTGNYTLNFTTAMPDVDYAAALGAANAPGSAYANLGPTARTTSAIQIYTVAAGALADNGYVQVAVFR